MHALNTLMHALMMHYNARVNARVDARVNARVDARVNARVDARVNTHAMQFAWMRIRCSLRECVCDAVCVNAYAMQSA